MDQIHGRVRVKIISAVPLDKGFLSKTVLALQLAVGKEVIPEMVYDKSMLGGMRAEIGGLVFDGKV